MTVRIAAATLLAVLILASPALAGWPMRNDPSFDPTVTDPRYAPGEGPRILLDGAHHNFFVRWDFIGPFVDLARSDGYRPVKGDRPFTSDGLAPFDIVMIVTALPFEFTAKTEVTTETTFTASEIDALHGWVEAGGSLLVFSEHAPFDQAIAPLLERFGITTSVGYTVDPRHHAFDREGWIVYSRENGLLHTSHPITDGIDRVITFGGSALTGEGYTNLLALSPSAENRRHPTGVGPEGSGDSQAIAGSVGKGKIVAFGDSNGFTALTFESDGEPPVRAGMETEGYDWKRFVRNVLAWLAAP